MAMPLFGTTGVALLLTPALLAQSAEVVSPAAGSPEIPLEAEYAISRVLGAEDDAYHASATAGRAIATNRHHDLRAEITSDRVRVLTGDENLGLGLDRIGIDGVFTRVSAGQWKISDNRVEVDRDGILEWYVNGPLGLQQGFTVHREREGTTSLTLGLDPATTAVAVVDDDRRGLTFHSPDGTTTRYRGLIAFDADGTDLDTHLQADGDGVRIVVDVAGATYPITVDPLLEKGELTHEFASHGEGLGSAIAMDGDTIVALGSIPVVGANPGAAMVFVKPASGWANMTQSGRLISSGTNFAFGSSVAIDDDVIVIGAAGYKSSPVLGGGAAYVFVRSNPNWGWVTETARLIPSDPAPIGQFGISVAIEGDTIVVGAHEPGGGGFLAGPGGAYVFEKPSTGWADATETAKLTSSNPSLEDRLGYSVAIANETIFAGAYDHVISGIRVGAVFVFEKTAGQWVDGNESAILTADFPWSNSPAEWLGGIVVASGDVVASTNGGATINGQPSAGAIHVWEKPPTGWVSAGQDALLTSPDPITTTTFGFGEALAMDGDQILVGTLNGEAAYLYERPDTGWADTDVATKLERTGFFGRTFGRAVAISDGVAAIAQEDADRNGIFDRGVVYVYEGPDKHPNTGCGAGDTLSLFGSVRVGGTMNATMPSPCTPTASNALFIGTPLPTPWSFPPGIGCAGAPQCLLGCNPVVAVPGTSFVVAWPNNPAFAGATLCVQGACQEQPPFPCYWMTDAVSITLAN